MIVLVGKKWVCNSINQTIVIITILYSCGVPGYQFYIGRDSKQIKIRSLTGPERLKMFTNISIADRLPIHSHNQSVAMPIQELWTDLLQLNKSNQMTSHQMIFRSLLQRERTGLRSFWASTMRAM